MGWFITVLVKSGWINFRLVSELREYQRNIPVGTTRSVSCQYDMSEHSMILKKSYDADDNAQITD